MDLQAYVSFHPNIAPLMVIVVKYASAVVIAYGHSVDDCLDPGSFADDANIIPAITLIRVKPFPSLPSIRRFGF